MFNISSYLDKFKKMEPEGDSTKRAAESAIFETLGVKVEKKDMAMRNGVLHISAPASVKSEIFMNKRGILKKARESGGKQTLVDIR